MQTQKVRRLLVLDDEFMIATDIADQLEEAGYEIVGPVRTLVEAQRIVSVEKIDGAVLDVNLGSENSLGLAQQLLRKGVPMLFVTGFSKEFLKGPFVHMPHIQKPFTNTELLKNVAALFHVPCAP